MSVADCGGCNEGSTSSGGVYGFGDAPSGGGLLGTHLNAPIVGATGFYGVARGHRDLSETFHQFDDSTPTPARCRLGGCCSHP
jgi:hypothetical protein